MTEETDLVPELGLARIRRNCAGRIPARVAHLVRLEVDVDFGITGHSPAVGGDAFRNEPVGQPSAGSAATTQRAKSAILGARSSLTASSRANAPATASRSAGCSP